ncbi:MAG TPA: GNAT family N-acetyltransferase, partial [Acidimicrobiales bacterium]|nr:GNAT family N-acetyltransferase [Acidimicrobiales bacterium]
MAGSTAGTGAPGVYPQEWEFDALLADGTTVHVRPIRRSDAEALAAFHAGLSRETVYKRFFGFHPELTPAEVAHFTEVDYVDRFALVALLQGELVGVARYDLWSPHNAEVAFVVADAQQGRGIASLLLEHLAAAARQQGIHSFQADVLHGNREMLGVFRDAGFEESLSLKHGIIRVEFSILETDRALRAADERERRAEVASIRRLLHPNTLAVIGASRKPGTIGHALMENLLQGDFAGTVYPVNPAATSVLGVQAYPDIGSVPGPVDLAVIAVPAKAVTAVVEECGTHQVKNVVVVSAGFAETGEEGRERQRQLTSVARRHGMRLIGPNCLGVVNTAPEPSMNATFAPVAPKAGGVGFLSQSGALGIAVLEQAVELGLGVSTFVSVGNKADVSGNDLLWFWETDPCTKVVLLYLESFGNPRKFARIARRVATTKPIVALKAGRSSQGAGAARSHTAAIATPEVNTDALFRQAGVIRVRTMSEMFDVLLVLDTQPVPAGSRVAIVGNSGGPGILAADTCEDVNLELAHLAPETGEALAFLPPEASLANPIDLVAAARPEHYERALDALLADPGVDAVVTIFTPTLVTGTEEACEAIVAAANRHPDKPISAVVLESGSGPRQLRGQGPVRVPVFPFPEEAVRAVGHVAGYGAWLRRPAGTVPELPGFDADAARGVVTTLLGAAPGEGRWLDWAEITTLLATAGVSVVGSRTVSGAEGAVAAATELGYPVALKAASPTLVHKSDVGAVVVGLGSAADVRAAYEDMEVRLGATTMGGGLVQSMAPPGVETIVGVTQDPAFGPLIAFGLGGTATELLGDVAFRILPLTDLDAHELVRSVRAAPLLLGYRGAPLMDVDALEDLLLRVGALAVAVPELRELDLNPVIVGQAGLAV